jgi:hypothetical protein
LPSTVIPELRYWRANGPSFAAGFPTYAAVPWFVGMPRTSVLSLTYVGTPASSPSTVDGSNRSYSSYTTAFSAGSTFSARAIAASATSRALTSPLRIRSAIATAS